MDLVERDASLHSKIENGKWNVDFYIGTSASLSVACDARNETGKEEKRRIKQDNMTLELAIGMQSATVPAR